MDNQADRQSGLPTTQWQLGHKPYKSPNHRLASLVGVLTFSIILLLIGTACEEAFSALFQSSWIGDLFIFAIAAILGGLVRILAEKILNRFRPQGRQWPHQQG